MSVDVTHSTFENLDRGIEFMRIPIAAFTWFTAGHIPTPRRADLSRFVEPVIVSIVRIQERQVADIASRVSTPRAKSLIDAVGCPFDKSAVRGCVAREVAHQRTAANNIMLGDFLLPYFYHHIGPRLDIFLLILYFVSHS